ncbi:hypothetical protein AGLY_000897 [Aphis glycines]|uniref:Uncharacterized protein n=1 Tax=Aphis glycines TaxID=307491 RepID=A0A6G0U8F3_APHGL|nr:hypothetical protein AGLY_000897 [Aphis glycines]
MTIIRRHNNNCSLVFNDIIGIFVTISILAKTTYLELCLDILQYIAVIHFKAVLRIGKSFHYNHIIIPNFHILFFTFVRTVNKLHVRHQKSSSFKIIPIHEESKNKVCMYGSLSIFINVFLKLLSSVLSSILPLSGINMFCIQTPIFLILSLEQFLKSTLFINSILVLNRLMIHLNLSMLNFPTEDQKLENTKCLQFNMSNIDCSIVISSILCNNSLTYILHFISMCLYRSNVSDPSTYVKNFRLNEYPVVQIDNLYNHYNLKFLHTYYSLASMPQYHIYDMLVFQVRVWPYLIPDNIQLKPFQMFQISTIYNHNNYYEVCKLDFFLQLCPFHIFQLTHLAIYLELKLI